MIQSGFSLASKANLEGRPGNEWILTGIFSKSQLLRTVSVLSIVFPTNHFRMREESICSTQLNDENRVEPVLFNYDGLSLPHGISKLMAKFIFSLGDANFLLLKAEAKSRDITIQELIRAVIIPDWMKPNLEHKALVSPTSLFSSSTGYLAPKSSIIPTPIGRLKTS